VETTAEVSGAYDMIVQGRCASLAEYNEHMDAIRPFIAEFVTRIETSFIGKVIESSNDDEESETLWLPCEDGHKQVPTHMVDKVEAEGDYMRVHVGDWNCLVHETFYRLSERLGPTDFIKLHRSALVRIGFIDRIIHRDHRWTALLRDGSRINVAKSQVHHVVQVMSSSSSNGGGDSSDDDDLQHRRGASGGRESIGHSVSGPLRRAQ